MLRYRPDPMSIRRSFLLLVCAFILNSLVGSVGGSIYTTYYADDYNILSGAHLSGNVLSSVTNVDSEYFIVRSAGTDTSVNTYNPSAYASLGSTSQVSGSVASLNSDDGVNMVFRSCFNDTDIQDYADNNMNDVDSGIDKGTHSDFSAQQAGPDAVFDALTEKDTNTIIFEQVTVSSVQSTPTTVWTDVPGASVSFTPNSSAEEWLIYVTADIRSSSTLENQARFRYLVDGVSRGETGVQQGTTSTSPVYPYNSYFHFSRITGVTSQQTVRFQYQASFGATAYARNVHILCIRLDPAGLVYTEVNGDVSITGSQTLATLQFTPISSGNYIVTYCALVSELPTGAGGAETWLDYDSGTSLQPEAWSTPNTRRIHTDRAQFEPHGLFTKINMTAVQHTFRVRSQLRTAGEDSTARDVRIAAFRVDAFSLFEYDEDTATSSTTGANIVRSVVNVASPGEQRDYLILAGIHTTASGTSSRETGGIEIDDIFVQRKGDARLSFSEIARIASHFANVKTSSTSFKVETTYGTGGTGFDTVYSKQSVIYILQIPKHNELDLEVQWTSVDFDESGGSLCIYGGIMGSESVQIDVWNGTAWQNILADLASGWNNVSVSSYLYSSTFTIRFKGSIETNDTTQDNWNIDATILHTRIDKYEAEVEFAGSSDIYSWKALNWTIVSAWTIPTVDVTVQLYNYASDGYPTSGDGHIAYTSSSTPNTHETKYQLIMSSPQDFVNDTGCWKIKVKGETGADTEFDLKADLIELKPTYTEQLVSAEFLFSSMISNVPTQLNFTLVGQSSVSSVNVEVQIWDYSSSTYPISGEGYLTYASLGSNETFRLSIDTTPQFYTSDGNAKVKITGILIASNPFQLEINQVKLVYGYDALATPFDWLPTLLYVSPLVIGPLFLVAFIKLKRRKPTEPQVRKTSDSISKFFGMTHKQMAGKKILFEIDPTSDFHNALLSFVSEVKNNSESLLILTNKASTLHWAFSGDSDVNFLLLTSKTSSPQKINKNATLLPATDLSVLLDAFAKAQKVKSKSNLNVLFDNLSDIILRCGFNKTYTFTRFLLEAISSPKTTALFLFNPTAHEPSISSSIRGLFQIHLTYTKNGLNNGTSS